MSSRMYIILTVTDNIAHITMNRPEAMNAMSKGLITELHLALESAQRDPNVSLIVLSGAGGNFCAGDDLKEAEAQPLEDFLALIMDLQRLTRLLLLGEKPTIAV
jgi:enoyl-CoA hydratase/carnithine racemase